MNNSILDDIKHMIGLDVEYKVFDIDIITYINTTFAILRQLGANGAISIYDRNATWSELFGDQIDLIELIKSYVVIKVRLLFDPPASATIVKTYEDVLAELAWRINVLVDPESTFE